MSLTRRAWMAYHARLAFGMPALAAMPIAGCALATRDEPDRIVDVPTGERLQPDDVMRRMRQADVVLLGELHDNPMHHARRATLLEALSRAMATARPGAPGHPLIVVAEHLPRGTSPRLHGSLAGDALRQVLEAAGFAPRAWGWPLHEPVFATVARAGYRLQGGNLEREAARRVAREGAGAMPGDLRPALDAAPLRAAAQASLERDLLRGHCGHLGPDRLPGMVGAQRARDAAMATTILSALDAAPAADPGRAGDPGSRAAPVLLLAGNGHVRRDYGVPQLLERLRPQLRLLSVGFLEPGGDPPAALPYDIVWITRAAEREDPCKAFTAPPPPARARPG